LTIAQRCTRHVASFLHGDVFEALKTDIARLEQPDGGGPNGIRAVVGLDLTFSIPGMAVRR